MAKLEGPLYGDSATGELAGVLGFKKGIPFTSPGDEAEIPYGRLEKKRKAARSRSPGQAAIRDIFVTALGEWRAFSSGEKETWRAGAPAGWTGFNYYLFTRIRSAGFYLGALVFGRDLFNQGNLSGRLSDADFVLNFPDSADTVPTFEDGTDILQALVFMKLNACLMGIENYLITFKENIERT